jgi:hypothetical protein
MMIDDAGCTHEIKSRNAIAEGFNRKKTLFTSTLDFNLRKTGEVLHLEHSTIWCWNLDTLKSRSEIPGKF